MGQSVLFAILARVLAVVVLAVVLRPLWRSARAAAAGAGACALLAAVGLYRMRRHAGALDAGASRAAADPGRCGRAARSLRSRAIPSNSEGWRLLGRAYASRRSNGRRRATPMRARRRWRRTIRTCSSKPPKPARWRDPPTAVSTPKPSALLRARAGGAAAAPARALVPRHRPAPGRQARRSGGDLGAACWRRSTPTTAERTARADRRRARGCRPVAAGGADGAIAAEVAAGTRATRSRLRRARSPARRRQRLRDRAHAERRRRCRSRSRSTPARSLPVHGDARRRRQPDADAETVRAVQDVELLARLSASRATRCASQRRHRSRRPVLRRACRRDASTLTIGGAAR